MQVSPANNSGPECCGWAKSKQNMQRKHTHKVVKWTLEEDCPRIPITIDLYLKGNLKHKYLHQNTPEPHVNVREGLAATREEAESREKQRKTASSNPMTTLGKSTPISDYSQALFPTWQEPFSPAGCTCMASGCWDQSRHNGVKDISDLLCMYVVHQASAALGLLLFGNSKLQWICVKSKCHDIGDNSQLKGAPSFEFNWPMQPV